MASPMGVQSFAAERNSDVEFLVHFLLKQFGNWLEQSSELRSIHLIAQHRYCSEIASDVWDHCLVGTQRNGRDIELWCQTTCYKGNGTGTPEPNKTYEVRETLVEGLSIRERFLKDSSSDFRSIHFTVGDQRYTYQWFLDLKSSIYDKSVYIGDSGYDIFLALAETLGLALTEEDKAKALADSIRIGSPIGNYIGIALQSLKEWWDMMAPIVNTSLIEFQVSSSLFFQGDLAEIGLVGSEVVV